MPSGNRKDEFSKLLRDHSSHLYGYILSLVHHPDDAEDLCQQTILTLWRKFDQYQAGSNFGAWACTVARYDVLNFLQRRSRERLQFSDELIEQITERQAQLPVETVSVRQQALRQCMETLSEEQRQILQQCYEGSESVKEISERIGRTPHSVHSSLRHIRGKLLECIQWRLNESGEDHDNV